MLSCFVVVIIIPSSLTQIVLHSYLQYVLHVESHWMGILVVIQLSVAAALVGWQFLCDRYGKKNTFCYGVVYWVRGVM